MSTKIGVALAGCDMGGLAAYAVLDKLCEKGYELDLISSCCIPTVTTIMYAFGFDCEKTRIAARDFQALRGKGTGISAIAGLFPPEAAVNNKTLAINAINIFDGKIITFTNAFSIRTEKLRTFPLEDAGAALNATMSHSPEFEYRGCALCDYSLWFGCPLYPLKMSGILKTISVSFLPACPKTPYEALVKHMIAKSSKESDVHIPIEFEPGLKDFDDYAEFSAEEIERHINRTYWRTLF